MDFTVTLDAPDAAVKRIQVAQLGDFSDARYGDFSITADDVSEWQKNLSALPGGQALIDFEHRSQRKPKDSKAAGWISGLELDGQRVMADVEWTPPGEQAIRDRTYRFMSPLYGAFKTPAGETLDNVFQSAALTNVPFLSGMAAVSLASADRVSEALDADPVARFYQRALDGDLGEHAQALVMLDVPQAERDQAVKENNALPDGSYPVRNVKQLKAAAILAASHHGNWKAALTLIKRRAKELGVALNTLTGFADTASAKSLDSRRSMDTAILTALGLDGDSELVTALDALELDDTSTRKILDAATGLADKAKPAPAVKTLDQQLADKGLVALDGATLIALQADAKAGAQAQLQLHESRFTTAFDAALQARKVTPGERDSLHHFYALDADATLTAIEAREPIVPAAPIGRPAIELDLNTPMDAEAVARSGAHPNSRESYRKIQARLKALDKPQSEFLSVMQRMMEDGEL